VVPSLWPEPFGSVGPTAGSHGLPAAAFAVGGIPQWLVDGVTGHLAPGDPPTASGLARAIVQCLDDRAHHASLREGARQMAGTFTMKRHLPGVLKAFAVR
jgi:glycosyltransferase involved in cell wall biosynthesis